MRRLILFSALLLASAARAAERPNIVLVVVDDCGVGDFGFSGGKDFPTPNLDRLAAGGVVFANGYALPSCSPTRAALMTGRYPQRFGIEDNRPLDGPRDGMDVREVTLPQRLREAGYHTRLIGKWHLGKGARFEFAPRNRGFDAFFGYFGASCVYVDPVLSRNGEERQRPGYITDLLTDEACRFLREKHDKPFFLHLAHMAAHLPQAAKPEDLKRVSHLSGKRQMAAAILTNLDDNMGRLLAALKETGQEANTLLFFLSDNGAEPPVLGTDNGPHRGMKFDVLEGGIHVPVCVRWPAALPAGLTYGPMIHAVDVFATALAAAGAACPGNVDGVDLSPFLQGKQKGVPHQRLFWLTNDHKEWRIPGRDTNLARPLRAVREGVEKLVVEGDSPPALYDLSQDLGETNNLASERPARVAVLRQAYDAWRAQMKPQHIPDDHPIYGRYRTMKPAALPRGPKRETAGDEHAVQQR
jgi:arylsulfatase A-like enzyme